MCHLLTLPQLKRSPVLGSISSMAQMRFPKTCFICPREQNDLKDLKSAHLERMTELIANHSYLFSKQACLLGFPLGLLPTTLDHHSNRWAFARAVLIPAETRFGSLRILLRTVCNLRFCSWKTATPIIWNRFLIWRTDQLCPVELSAVMGMFYICIVQ